MDKFLDFREIEKECRKRYKKSPFSYEWSDKGIEIFFKDRQISYSHYVKLIIDEEYPYLQDMKLKWVIIGDFFEFLIKMCLLKENWNNLGMLYDSEKKEFYKFEVPKQLLMDSLKLKLENKKLTRIREILDFIQLQRNNFVHNPLAGMDHYAVEKQYLELILLLNEKYSLNFLEEDLNKINERIKFIKLNSSGMDFEDKELNKSD